MCIRDFHLENRQEAQWIQTSFLSEFCPLEPTLFSKAIIYCIFKIERKGANLDQAFPFSGTLCIPSYSAFAGCKVFYIRPFEVTGYRRQNRNHTPPLWGQVLAPRTRAAFFNVDPVATVCAPCGIYLETESLSPPTHKRHFSKIHTFNFENLVPDHVASWVADTMLNLQLTLFLDEPLTAIHFRHQKS